MEDEGGLGWRVLGGASAREERFQKSYVSKAEREERKKVNLRAGFARQDLSSVFRWCWWWTGYPIPGAWKKGPSLVAV